MDIQETLHLHELWLSDKSDGVCADLSGANLREANLYEANLHGADLYGADLSKANLSKANLREANLYEANLREANLYEANLHGADLYGADLSKANLSKANLCEANLGGANLHGANLGGADLYGANLSKANLSGATGLDDPAAWLAQFECDDRGIIVYKRLGEGKTQYAPPAHWEERIGAILTETVNPDRGTECGSGVNFGMLEWCQKNYTEAHLWKCRIAWIDLAGIIVPFNTDGKARCARLELLELVS